MLMAQFPRSASAYENAVTTCDDEWDDLPTSTSFCESVDEEPTVEKKTLEVILWL